MNDGVKTIIFPVSDVAKSKAVFAALLGVEPYADQPYYVGYRAGGQEIGLDPNGHRTGTAGPVVYWDVDDIAGSIKALVESGAAVKQDVKDVGGGKLTAILTDGDGNPFGLLQNP